MKKMLINKLVTVNIIMMVLALVASYLMQMGDWKSIVILGIFLLVTTIVQVIVVTQYLNKNFVNAIDDVNAKLNEITHGNLDARVEVDTTSEFAELSGHINDMVKSILETTDKFSVVLDNVELSVGVYEYGSGMARVRATKQVADILFFDVEKAQRYLADYILFADYLDAIRSHPYDEEKHIYQVLGEEAKYVKLESYQKESSVFGMVTDVTESVVEQIRLAQEKKEDVLTGLPSRSSLYTMLDELFEKPQKLEESVLAILDIINLKQVNDAHGVLAGDKYLCGVADCLKTICPQKSIVSRLTGGEFVVFIHGCQDEEELEEYLDILKKRNGYEIMLEEETAVTMEFALGCAYYGKDGRDYHDLMKLADESMYEEKRMKKEKIEV
ncbi:MAG: diguanylate cyclase [Lachnospiraceae bacterium]|nr:diguanylate cyclase [Lachnospiraceae bacterium]